MLKSQTEGGKNHRKIFFDYIWSNKRSLSEHNQNVEQCWTVCMCVWVCDLDMLLWDVCYDKENLERICMIMLSPLHIWKITTQTPITPPPSFRYIYFDSTKKSLDSIHSITQNICIFIKKNLVWNLQTTMTWPKNSCRRTSTLKRIQWNSVEG